MSSWWSLGYHAGCRESVGSLHPMVVLVANPRVPEELRPPLEKSLQGHLVVDPGEKPPGGKIESFWLEAGAFSSW